MIDMNALWANFLNDAGGFIVHFGFILLGIAVVSLCMRAILYLTTSKPRLLSTLRVIAYRPFLLRASRPSEQMSFPSGN